MKYPSENTVMVRETVGVLKDINTLQDAVDELEQNGFRHEELSVLANGEKAQQENLLRPGMRVKDIMDDPDTPRSTLVPREVIREARAATVGLPLYFGAGIGAIIATINDQPLVAIIVWACVTGAIGAFIGGFFSVAIYRWWRNGIQRQLDRGGLVLWVHVDSPDKERKARTILSRHHARHLHTHKIPAKVPAE